MSVTIKRLDEGTESWHAPTDARPSGYCQNAEIPYLVMGAGNRAAAIAAVIAEAPDNYNGTPLQEVRFDEWSSDVATVAAVYQQKSGGAAGGGDDDEPMLNYDCGGGTVHVVQAISQTRVYGGSTDDAGGMIGWNGKGGSEADFAGVDIPCGEMRLGYTKSMRISQLTNVTYMKTVAACVGRINSATWRGWEPGELMFLGCSYSTPLRGSERISVTFNFKAQRNESNAVVGGHSVGSKKGFEYLWSRSNAVTETNGTPANNIVAIYKSVVCKEADFSVLGI
jgi:hypothetical protein